MALVMAYIVLLLCDVYVVVVVNGEGTDRIFPVFTPGHVIIYFCHSGILFSYLLSIGHFSSESVKGCVASQACRSDATIRNLSTHPCTG